MYLNAHTHSTVVDLRAKRSSSEVKLWDSFHTLRQDPLDNLNLWFSEVSARIWWCFLQVHSAIWTCTAGKKCVNFCSILYLFQKGSCQILENPHLLKGRYNHKDPNSLIRKICWLYSHLLVSGQQMIFMKASLAAKAASGRGSLRICELIRMMPRLEGSKNTIIAKGFCRRKLHLYCEMLKSPDLRTYSIFQVTRS